ncbi:LAFE_0E09362g1_1 [Lachancea fermentati]|uniref:LAFE_0E09362g1_1 n=1 Tax=Lachancea fermentati TaxID=4955 RepID=A0A1G4MDD4_LACFM|nr:LAFE_0E09362g1_1 [Lachancea fermentati]
MSLTMKRQLSDGVQESQEKRLQTSSKDYLAMLVSLIPGKEGKIPISYQTVTSVGRSRSCDITLAEPDISTLHCNLCLLDVNVDGEPRKLINIVDKSRNGTFINGSKLVRRDYILKNGDRVVFGRSCSFLFKYFVEDQIKGDVSSEIHQAPQESSSSFKKPMGLSQTLNKEPIRKALAPISFFDKYVAGKELGTGHYAIVKEAINKDSGDVVAVKIFHPQQNDDKKKTKQFRDETKILMSIKHTNIVKLIDRFVEPVSKSQIQTYLVLEKVSDGELFDRIVRKTKLRQDETRAIFKQILSGLKYLHDKNIIHRDIKPENILLSIRKRRFPQEPQLGPWDDDEMDITIKIADFGLAKFIGEMQFTNTLCGTPSYVAPEVLQKTGYCSKVDLWSAGVLLYVCLCGFPPFSDQLAPPSMREQILQGKFAFYSPYWDEIDDSVLHLISNLLLVNPAVRYTVNDTINHPWFSATEKLGGRMQLDRLSLEANRIPKTYSELSKIDHCNS